MIVRIAHIDSVVLVDCDCSRRSKCSSQATQLIVPHKASAENRGHESSGRIEPPDNVIAGVGDQHGARARHRHVLRNPEQHVEAVLRRSDGPRDTGDRYAGPQRNSIALAYHLVQRIGHVKVLAEECKAGGNEKQCLSGSGAICMASDAHSRKQRAAFSTACDDLVVTGLGDVKVS